MRSIRNDTQIPGSICGRTLTKEEAQEVERMTMIPRFGHPEPEVSRIFPVGSWENSSGAQQWNPGYRVDPSGVLSRLRLLPYWPLCCSSSLAHTGVWEMPHLSSLASLLVPPCPSLHLRKADMDGISRSCSHLFCLEVWCHPTSSERALMEPSSVHAWWLTSHFLHQEHRPVSIQHLLGFATCQALC